MGKSKRGARCALNPNEEWGKDSSVPLTIVLSHRRENETWRHPPVVSLGGSAHRGAKNSFRCPLCNTSTQICTASSASAQRRCDTVCSSPALTFRLLGPTPGEIVFLYKCLHTADAADSRTHFEDHWSNTGQILMMYRYLICVSFSIDRCISLHNNVIWIFLKSFPALDNEMKAQTWSSLTKFTSYEPSQANFHTQTWLCSLWSSLRTTLPSRAEAWVWWEAGWSLRWHTQWFPRVPFYQLHVSPPWPVVTSTIFSIFICQNYLYT